MEDNPFVYCHLYTDNTKGIIYSVKFPYSSKVVTAKDFITELSKYLSDHPSSNLKYIPNSISKTLIAPQLKEATKFAPFFSIGDDVYIQVSTEIIPAKIQVQNEGGKDIVLTYQTITSYSFYVASETIVRVLIPIPGIAKVPQENIISHFSEDSIDIKVHNAENGINYRFAVPRLDAKIIPEKSEAMVKGDKLVLRLRKAKNDDHWTYLFKQKYVGE